MLFTCQACGQGFNAYPKSGRKYCCKECQHVDRHRATSICLHCGIEYVPRGHGKLSERKYCSKECMSKAFRKKITRVCLTCGNNFDAIPAKVKYNEAKYCSRKCMYTARQTQTDEDKRIRNSQEMRNWTQSVLRRDNYLCQKCGTHSNLVAHHIIPFAADSSLRLEESNGITLCKKCHYEEHNKMNFSEQIDIFYVRSGGLKVNWRGA